MAGGLVVNAILARMLSPADMGAYFLLSSIVLFAAIVARFGLKQTVVRFVAESMRAGQPGRAASTVRSVYALVALGSFAVGAVYLLGLGPWLATRVFEMPLLQSVLGITVVWTAVLAFQTPVAETFRGLHDIRLAVFLDGILATMLLAIVLTLIRASGFVLSFYQAVVLTVTMAIASGVFGIFLLSRRAGMFRGEGSITVREILTHSAPLFVTNIANQALSSYALWLVGAYLLAGDVALFGAAWRLVALVALPLTLVNMTVQPVIAELHSQGEKQRLQNALRGMATLAGVPAAVILAVYIFLGAEILELVFGPHYAAAAPVLTVLSIGQLINVWSGSCGQVLAFTGHQKQLMLLTVATGVVSLALAIVGVGLYGSMGVATAVAIGHLLRNVSAWLLTYRVAGLWTHVTLSPTVLRFALARVRRR